MHTVDTEDFLLLNINFHVEAIFALVVPPLQRGFRMPDVRLAATGMDSCPASDEDTEDELEASQNRGRARFLLPSTSRQPVGNFLLVILNVSVIDLLQLILICQRCNQVGESHRPNFRPGLEGGSSDESQTGSRYTDTRTGIEHRRSAEGQVINSPIAGRDNFD